MRALSLLFVPFFAVVIAQPKQAQSCYSCHSNIANAYATTGMARSFAKPSPANTPGLPAAYHHAPSDSYFSVSARAGQFFQRRHQLDRAGREINVIEKRIDYVMGSGNHARAFLHRTPSGALIELPLGWYAEKGGYWAMNPGYDRPDHPGFRRSVTYDCMFCHNAYPDVPARNQRPGEDPIYTGALPEGISCERCHGPGSVHIAEASRAGARPDAIRQAIVNPARLPAERQMDICMSCHLESTSFPLPSAILRYDRGPFSFRPGEPLANFLLNFDHAPAAGREDKFEIVSSAYRLRQSACFLKSEGKLLCTTCHNPHRAPRGDAATQHYDAVCRNCHGKKAHPAPQAKSGCVECHMPKRRAEDVIHALMTDHRIQRKAPPGDMLAEKAERRDEYKGEVVPYYPPNLSNLPEGELYLAVAQIKQKSNLKEGIPQLAAAIAKASPARADWYLELAEALETEQLSKALPWYREAARRDPVSAVAQQKLGTALRRLGQHAESIQVLQQSLTLSPNRALTWHELALSHRANGQPSEALVALQKALANDPDLPEAHSNLAILHYATGNAASAEASFREAIRIKPDYADAHGNLASLLAAAGRPVEAQGEFEQSLRLRPNDTGTRYNYAMMLGQIQRYDEAQRELETCVRTDPAFADAHERLADLLSARNQFQAAIPHYQEAVRLRPDSARANLGLGMALAASGNTAAAGPFLRNAAASTDPDTQKRALQLLREIKLSP